MLLHVNLVGFGGVGVFPGVPGVGRLVSNLKRAVIKDLGVTGQRECELEWSAYSSAMGCTWPL